MDEADHVWRLVRGDELVAELMVTGGDFPWLNARVLPVAGFAEVRPLFEDELLRLDRLDDEPDLWEAAYRRIRDRVQLLAPDGQPVPEFLLHIEGEDARWRWSDEPFRNGKRALRGTPSAADRAIRNGGSLIRLSWLAAQRDSGPLATMDVGLPHPSRAI